MSGKSGKKRGSIALALPFIPLLMIKLGFLALRHKHRAKKGAREFRRALRKSGMTKKQVNILTEEYTRYASIRKMMGGDFGGFTKGFAFPFS